MIKRLITIYFLLAGVALAQTQKPYPGVDLANTWTANNTFIQISGTPVTVSGLPSAASNPYGIKWVSDSTVIGTEGQTCVGGGTTKAMAFSNGSVWSCFGSGTTATNQAVTFLNATSATITANYGTPAIVWACWDSNDPANAIYPANVTLDTGSFLMTFSFSVPQTGFCAINGSGGIGSTGGSGTVNVGTAGQIAVYPTSTNAVASANPVSVGIPTVIGSLDAIGVSTANSGTPQNVVASVPAAGHYKLSYYLDQSAGCSSLGSASITVQAAWTDGTLTRVDAGHTFPVTTGAIGTDAYISWEDDFWAANATPVTITATYVSCSSGTWTYDIHAAVVRLK